MRFNREADASRSDVDARDEPGHDGHGGAIIQIIPHNNLGFTASP
jgi:hypothetical protein